MTDHPAYRVRHRSSATADRPLTRAGPMVRIRFPPAVSLQTFGSWQASSASDGGRRGADRYRATVAQAGTRHAGYYPTTISAPASSGASRSRSRSFARILSPGAFPPRKGHPATEPTLLCVYVSRIGSRFICRKRLSASHRAGRVHRYQHPSRRLARGARAER